MTAPDVCDDAAFPAVPESMAGVRAYVRGAVARYGTDVTEVAALLASEIATNSIVHSRSGGFGGRIAVAVIDGDRTVRVQVRDEGSEESIPCRALRDSRCASTGTGWSSSRTSPHGGAASRPRTAAASPGSSCIRTGPRTAHE